MPQVKCSILDLPQRRLSPSALCKEIAASTISQRIGGVSLYGGDNFGLNFQKALSKPDEVTLKGVLAAHTGEGPDAIKGTRRARRPPASTSTPTAPPRAAANPGRRFPAGSAQATAPALAPAAAPAPAPAPPREPVFAPSPEQRHKLSGAPSWPKVEAARAAIKEHAKRGGDKVALKAAQEALGKAFEACRAEDAPKAPAKKDPDSTLESDNGAVVAAHNEEPEPKPDADSGEKAEKIEPAPSDPDKETTKVDAPPKPKTTKKPGGGKKTAKVAKPPRGPKK